MFPLAAYGTVVLCSTKNVVYHKHYRKIRWCSTYKHGLILLSNHKHDEFSSKHVENDYSNTYAHTFLSAGVLLMFYYYTLKI